MQDFPLRKPGADTSCQDPFADEFSDVLMSYLSSSGVDASFLRDYDYSRCCVKLIASIPGYHRLNQPFQKTFGLVRLQEALQGVEANDAFSQLTWQYSSQGSLTNKFLDDMVTVMMGKSAVNPDPDGVPRARVSVVLPTEDEVRNSVEGWRAGLSIPLHIKNFHEFVNRRLHTWGTARSMHPRQYAMPHIKTYCRHNGDALAWLILTSANLSRAAWGELQKREKCTGTFEQLAIRSYELGVLFAPQFLHRYRPGEFSCLGSRIVRQPQHHGGVYAIPFQPSTEKNYSVLLPFDPLHPKPYVSTLQLSRGVSMGAISSTDTPWAVDAPHTGKDAMNRSYHDAVSRHSHYGPENWKAVTRDFRDRVIDVDGDDVDSPPLKRTRAV
jgi:tyrosyl-DNA phosphodiesterase-1